MDKSAREAGQGRVREGLERGRERPGDGLVGMGRTGGDIILVSNSLPLFLTACLVVPRLGDLG